MAEEHARAVARVAVGQIADVVGYDLAHGNALDAVADVMIRYIRELGTYAKEFAEYQGRTDVCVLDVVRLRSIILRLMCRPPWRISSQRCSRSRRSVY
jgi:histone H3/H4